MEDLVVIDGPNLFNAVGSYLARTVDKTLVPEYLETWFDIDRLVDATLAPIGGIAGGPSLGIVVFHSRKGLGRPPYRFDNPEAFWGRQATCPATSCMIVELPGVQTETLKCESCGGQLTTQSEKGVDSSIISYLFETVDRWDTVYIFSRDADFAPPIMALRRKGRKVHVALPADDRHMAHARVAQSIFELDTGFLRKDFAAFLWVRDGGILQQLIAEAGNRKEWLTAVHPDESMPSLGIVHDGKARIALESIIESTHENAKPHIRITDRNEQIIFIGPDVPPPVSLGHFRRREIPYKWHSQIGNINDVFKKYVTVFGPIH